MKPTLTQMLVATLDFHHGNLLGVVDSAQRALFVFRGYFVDDRPRLGIG